MYERESKKYTIERVESSVLSEKLKEIPDPPEYLWLCGALPPPENKTLAVVGSRALSHYGREACEALISGLSSYPITILSGLALGADACAHKAALQAGLHTIAVPGSGLAEKSIYPRANVGLSKTILEHGGTLLSEHPPEYRARSHDFPSRNRIMVGLSDAVLVIEAGARSGTLITCRMAADYNRDLLCVPHRIGDPHGAGANTFLRLGAILVSEPDHILEALGIRPHLKEETQRTITLSPEEQIVYELLLEPCSKDELLRTCPLPTHVTLSLLGMLEMKEVVQEKYGVWQRI